MRILSSCIWCLPARAAIVAAALSLLAAFAPAPAPPAPPDYGAWDQLLSRWYDPVRGMDYKDLKAKDGKTLAELRRRLAAVDAAVLAPPDQLAYWINVYNVNVVATVVDHYPVASIRDLSTDWVTRLNVFKKDSVPIKGGMTSLDEIENTRIRQGFKDPRIHFAINCAAVSCPPIRPEAFTGARVAEQLDDQTRRFLNDPRRGVQIEIQATGDKQGVSRLATSGAATDKQGVSRLATGGAATIVIHVTKVMDWFAEDFKKWGGGQVAFIRKYLPPEKQQLVDAARGNVKLDFYSYDWSLNDASPK